MTAAIGMQDDLEREMLFRALMGVDLYKFEVGNFAAPEEPLYFAKVVFDVAIKPGENFGITGGDERWNLLYHGVAQHSRRFRRASAQSLSRGGDYPGRGELRQNLPQSAMVPFLVCIHFVKSSQRHMRF